MFGLDRIQRTRHFELSWWPGLHPPPMRIGRGVFASGRGVSVSTTMCAGIHFYPRKRIGLPGMVPVVEAREVMGITTPMTARMVGEAVPPAYAEYLASRA